MRYIIMKELKSPVKVTKKLYLKDLFFLMGFMAVIMAFKILIDSRLQLAYFAFSFLMALILTAPSPYNPRRRNYQSIFIMLKRDKKIYKPIPKVENCNTYENALSILENR